MMIKHLRVGILGVASLGAASLGAASLAAPALAHENIEYPTPTPCYPLQRSVLTPRLVVIPPYDRVFRVRVYTTPQQQPYYNVPPYAVVTPY